MCPWRTPSILCALAMVSACGAEVEPWRAPQVSTSAPEHADVIIDAPTYMIELNKEQVLFFVDEDGSVGMLGAVRTGGSVLDHVALRDASPAVVYHALSRDPVPPELMLLQESLGVEEHARPFEAAIEGRSAGWMRNVSRATSSSPCLNATFSTNHCAHSSYDEHLCKLNSSASWTRQVSHAHRYKAGFCLQQGTSVGTLTYRRQTSGCSYSSTEHVVWGYAPGGLHPKIHSATTYLTYVWWRPSGASRRSFRHIGGYSSGDVFDWGQRWSRSTACD